MKDKASLLDDSKWGAHFDYATLEVFARHMRVVAFSAGRKIRRQGDHEACLYIITEGSVQVDKPVDDRRTETLITFGAGDTFGEMSLADGRPSAAEIVAVTAVQALALDAAQLDAMSEEAPIAAYRFTRFVAGILAKRLRRMTGLAVAHTDPSESASG